MSITLCPVPFPFISRQNIDWKLPQPDTAKYRQELEQTLEATFRKSKLVESDSAFCAQSLPQPRHGSYEDSRRKRVATPPPSPPPAVGSELIRIEKRWGASGRETLWATDLRRHAPTEAERAPRDYDYYYQCDRTKIFHLVPEEYEVQVHVTHWPLEDEEGE